MVKGISHVINHMVVGLYNRVFDDFFITISIFSSYSGLFGHIYVGSLRKPFIILPIY